jgi:hypothetical protein
MAGVAIATHGGSGSSAPVPAPPDGLGALLSAAWTDSSSLARQAADAMIIPGVAMIAITGCTLVAVTNPEHAQAILIGSMIGLGVLMTAGIAALSIVGARKGKARGSMMILSPRIEPTWIGEDALAYRRGATAHVLRYEDISAIVNDVNIDINPRDSFDKRFRYVLHVKDRAGKTKLAWRARLRADPTGGEALDQVPSLHPIHFGLAARKAWEAWRTRNELPI